MILVDSSVWIDYFNGNITPQTDYLDAALGHNEIIMGDLILLEILSGFRLDKDYNTAKELLTALDLHSLCNPELAIKASEYYRTLRKKGITIRKTIDIIIATYCLENDVPLLHSDKDFIPFIDLFSLESLV
ncbi:PIN domain nuclease [Paraneptunicella aestuarii]|uniref:type II toxin-antitoxin system VapC family toxin n=1 Tax=Paraneptunicella aestuarii TaxID=2831148 RepID=UPI001E2DC77F|nr:PIN domain nuclease [Paraneptunicella aestuarii]UAA38770.1 PIN domain nuclease [Paraneptunicella aestuarii]